MNLNSHQHQQSERIYLRLSTEIRHQSFGVGDQHLRRAIPDEHNARPVHIFSFLRCHQPLAECGESEVMYAKQESLLDRLCIEEVSLWISVSFDCSVWKQELEAGSKEVLARSVVWAKGRNRLHNS